ncbi:MAG: sigma-54 dependent transcriptional regulator [Acidobacteriota bacterium]
MSPPLSTAPHLLVVEDRASLRRMLEQALGGEGYRVTSVDDGRRGIEAIEQQAFDLVLSDLRLPGADGVEVLRACRAAQPSVPVVLLTGYGTVGTAVEAMKLGAWDFLEKPVEIEELFDLVARALGREEPAEPCLAVPGASEIVGAHPSLRRAARMVERVAPTESTVLLTGESGTGKELFARALHGLSERRTGPFVAVNCAAIPETLIESELFGHDKGAFTGADRPRQGRFEQARHGTLLLDEVGELSPAVQGKVLRVLEERTFERVGGNRTLDADVRLVAATNRDLERMLAEGTFRSDLYYRLSVFPIELPPLRDRASDIPALVRHLTHRIAERLGRSPVQVDEEALRVLAAEPWPGNVRELSNVLERALILLEGTRLTKDDLALTGATPTAADEDPREAVRRALIATDGDKSAAADRLGISLRTLQRRIKAYDLEGVPQYRK